MSMRQCGWVPVAVVVGVRGMPWDRFYRGLRGGCAPSPVAAGASRISVPRHPGTKSRPRTRADRLQDQRQRRDLVWREVIGRPAPRMGDSAPRWNRTLSPLLTAHDVVLAPPAVPPLPAKGHERRAAEREAERTGALPAIHLASPISRSCAVDCARRGLSKPARSKSPIPRGRSAGTDCFDALAVHRAVRERICRPDPSPPIVNTFVG
jgi:hypothetical protein